MVRALHLMRQWKHLTLLVSLLALILCQPVAQKGAIGLLVFDLLLTIVTVVVFFVVFERGSTRIVALLLAALVIFLHWLGRAVDPHDTAVTAANELVAVFFLGFAVTVILRGIFQPKPFHTDDLLGVVCGYLILGLAWGNLYRLADTMSPHSFRVESDVATELQEQSGRRHLFDTFSFVTLTCVGDSKVVPIGQTASTLTWLEAVIGQFYMAIVVAQLVGLKLTQARSDGSA